MVANVICRRKSFYFFDNYFYFFHNYFYFCKIIFIFSQLFLFLKMKAPIVHRTEDTLLKHPPRRLVFNDFTVRTPILHLLVYKVVFLEYTFFWLSIIDLKELIIIDKSIKSHQHLFYLFILFFKHFVNTFFGDPGPFTIFARTIPRCIQSMLFYLDLKAHKTYKCANFVVQSMFIRQPYVSTHLHLYFAYLR